MNDSQTAVFLADGFSANRPPKFEGAYFGYWKNRMELFIKTVNLVLWVIIVNGPQEVKANLDKLTDDDVKNVQLNSQAIKLMYCALGKEEFNRISTCKSAKKIWDKLCVTYEGTNLVKTSKINMLKQEFELFKMEPEESIRDMADRF